MVDSIQKSGNPQPKLLLDYFFARTDRVAFLAPWDKPHPTIQTDNLDELLSAHIHGDEGSKAAVHFTSRNGGHKVTKGWFRIGSYVPAPDKTTPWLCVDFDAGADHADALADPDEAVKRVYGIFTEHHLPAYLERSGGGLGWHLWCFFEPGIPASKVRKLALQLLPSDIPLAQGGNARPDKAKGIEVFPKQDKLNKDGLGNLVWLPWWFGAKGEGNRFFRINDGAFSAYQPDSFERIDQTALDQVLKATAKPDTKPTSPISNPDNSREWKLWRSEALATIQLSDIYGDLLTGNTSGDGWLECRDPSSQSGDMNPSAGVSDGTNSVERGSFHSFISGETISVFDFLVQHGPAHDMKGAVKRIAELSGVQLPRRKQSRSSPRKIPLPEIQVNHRQLRDIIEDAWDAVHLHNSSESRLPGDKPYLYNRSGTLVRIVREQLVNKNGEPFIRTRFDLMNESARYGLLARIASWYRETERGPVDVVPMREVSRDMPEFIDRDLPQIDSIVTAPVYSSKGVLIKTPGYHPKEALWYEPHDSLGKIDVPENPDNHAISYARDLILDEVLHDFPFKTQSDRAHMVAAMLLPFAQRMIRGNTPIHLFTAPTPGSGKGLLCSIVSQLATAQPADSRTLPTQEDETRKMITAELSMGGSIILLDNTSERRQLDSAPLASVVTSEVWKDRLLGQSAMLTLPNRAMWMITGNNPKLTAELARRCIRIRLQPDMERPWLREGQGFRHPKLVDWVKSNRTELVSALLILIQAWVAAGQHESAHTLGSFENWSSVIGGILDNAGIPGFLENLNDMYKESDEVTQAWSEFIVAWWDEFGDEPKRVCDLNQLCEDKELLPALRGDKNERSKQIRLGKALGRYQDRVFQGLKQVKVQLHGKHAGGFCVALQKVDPSPSKNDAENGDVGNVDGDVLQQHLQLGNPSQTVDSGNNGNVGDVTPNLRGYDHVYTHTRAHAHVSNRGAHISNISTDHSNQRQQSVSAMEMSENNISIDISNISSGPEQDFDLLDLPDDLGKTDESELPF